MGKWAIKWNFQPFMTSDGTLWNISWYKIPFKSLSRSNTAYNGPQGWGEQVIVSLWYWFILCSLLSDETPPITPWDIVARYIVIILLSDHIGLLHFMERKSEVVWWTRIKVHCVKNQFEWMFSWFSLSVSLDLRSWQFLVMGLHNIFLSNKKSEWEKIPVLIAA